MISPVMKIFGFRSSSGISLGALSDSDRNVQILVLVVVLQLVLENVFERHRCQPACPDMAGEGKRDFTGGIDDNVPIELGVLQDRNAQGCRPISGSARSPPGSGRQHTAVPAGFACHSP